MPNYCSHCGAKVVAGESHCLSCGTPLSRGNWLGRLLGGLLGIRRHDDDLILDGPGSPPHQAMNSFKITREVGIDSSTANWEDLPEEVRQQLEHSELQHSMIDLSGTGVRISRREDYTYTDESGVVRHYKSLDEMPPDVRRLFEKLIPPEMQ